MRNRIVPFGLRRFFVCAVVMSFALTSDALFGGSHPPLNSNSTSVVAAAGSAPIQNLRINPQPFAPIVLAQLTLGVGARVDVSIGSSRTDSNNDKKDQNQNDDRPLGQGGAPVPEPSTWMGLISPRLLSVCDLGSKAKAKLTRCRCAKATASRTRLAC